MCKVIGVVSLKGGVGKTSSVVNMGYALSKLGKKVLLVDGNLSAPNLGLHLNLVDPENGLHEVLQRKSNPSDAIIKLDDFDVIVSKLMGDEELEYLSLKKRLGHIKNNYDVVLIDSSPKLDEETLAVMLASDEILVVTTPDLPTLGTTIKAIQLAKKRGTPIGGLVLNRVYNKDFEISLKDVEETLGIPVLAVIPHDIGFLKSLSNFESFVKDKPKSEASEEYMKLAGSLVGEKYKPLKMKSFFRWVNPRKQDVNRAIYYRSLFD